MKQKKKKDSLDLSLTMQQKFNFDSNNLEEESIVLKQSKKNQRIKEIIRIKNMYKKKYKVVSAISIFLFILCLGISFAYLYIKPKEVVKKIEIPIMDENIVFLGDSITELYDLNKYYSDYYVVNSGVGGNSTDDILTSMNERVYQYNPTKVFILIGINDLKHEKSIDYIYNNILKIVEEIKKNRSQTKIYVESIYPINDSEDEKINRESVVYRKNSDITKINKRLEKHFKNSDVIYIDVYKELIDSDNQLKLEYTKEGVHLTPLGYIKVTKILLPYLQN